MRFFISLVVGAATVIDVAAQPAFRIEDLRIETGAVELGASVYVPVDCQNCPGVVLIGGGSATTRDRQAPFAEQFSRRGIVSLIYDKRGTGESSGSFEHRTFDQLADDAAAAFGALKDHPAVEPARAGLWGGSEGGTLALITAMRIPDVAFVVNLAGPVDELREGKLAQVEQSASEAGVNADSVEVLVQTWDEYYEDALDDMIGVETIDLIRRLRSTSLGPWLPPDETQFPPDDQPDIRSFSYLNRISALRPLEMPVLFIYGGADEFVPAETNVIILERVFSEVGKTNYEVRVFERASHAFTTPDGGLVEGFFESQIRWMQDQTGRLERD